MRSKLKTEKGRTVYALIIIVLLGLLSFIIYYKININQKEKKEEIVAAQKPVGFVADGYVVKTWNDNSNAVYRGAVQADRMVTVSPAADGRVIYSRIQKGNMVYQGELLLQLDAAIRNTTQSQNYNNYRKAKNDYEKLSTLALSGNATGEEISNARLQMQAAAAQIRITAKQIQQTAVYAPVSGIITDKKINRGEYAGTGNPIATIVNLSSVLVTIYIEQTKIRNLHSNDKVRIFPDAFPGRVMDGHIESIIPVASAAGTFPIQVRVFNNGQQWLMDGMTVSVQFPHVVKSRVLAIPRKALAGDPSHPTVYLYRRGQSPRLKNITLGDNFGDMLQVTNGLNAGDTVLTSGQQNIGSNAILRSIRIQP